MKKLTQQGSYNFVTWRAYLNKYKDPILDWVFCNAQKHYDELLFLIESPISSDSKIERQLRKIWYHAPDGKTLQGKAFFNICDLLDGNWRIR